MKSTEHRRTRHFNIMLVLLAVASLIAVLIAIDPTARASQGSRHGWSGHHRTQGAGMAFCENGHDGGLGRIGTHLKTWLDLDAAQAASWTRVESEIEQGLAALRDVCGNLAQGMAPATMPDRLAQMESAMAVGTEALRAVRPAFAEFYGTLDEGQRRKIDGFSGRHAFGDR